MDNLDRIRELTHTLIKIEENLKKEKNILEFVLEHSTDGYWDWNIQTNYEYLSRKFKLQLGYRVDEMANSPEAWMSICNPDDVQLAYKQVKRHIKGEIDEISQVLRFTHKQGHEIKILCRGKIVEWTEDRKPLRMIGTHVIID
jgi:PAS domain S-box-containing protein